MAPTITLRIAALAALVLVAAPAASASSVSPFGTRDETGMETLVPGTGPATTQDLAAPHAILDAAAAAQGTAAALQDTALGLLNCREAVRLDLHWWGGTLLDSRDGAADLRAPKTAVVATLVAEVPVYATVTEVVWQPAGLLAGLLDPVTRDVTRLVGYETTVTEVARDVDLAVHLEWHEDYVAWTPEVDTLYLALPVGLPFLATGEGSLVTACEGQAILDHVPAPDAGAYDFYSFMPMADGWYAHLLSLEVALARPDQMGLPFLDAEGWTICPTDILAQAEVAVAGYSLSPGELDRLAKEPIGDGAGAATSLSPAGSPQAALQVPASTAAALAGLASLGLAGLASAGRALLRRK